MIINGTVWKTNDGWLWSYEGCWTDEDGNLVKGDIVAGTPFSTQKKAEKALKKAVKDPELVTIVVKNWLSEI